MSDTKQQCPQCEKWQQVSGLNTPEELDKIMDNVLAKNLAPIRPLLDALVDAPSGGPRCPACGESLALDGNPPTPSGCSNEECAAFAYARESQPSPAVAPNNEWIGTVTDACQVFDGWHNDGTAWSQWDEEVRQRLSKMLKQLYELKSPAVAPSGARESAAGSGARETLDKLLALVGEHVSDYGFNGAMYRYHWEDSAKAEQVLRDYADSLTAPLREQLEEALEKSRQSTCVYCGFVGPKGNTLEEFRANIVNHVKDCEKHPVRAFAYELAEAEQRAEAAERAFESALEELWDVKATLMQWRESTELYPQKEEWIASKRAALRGKGE